MKVSTSHRRYVRLAGVDLAESRQYLNCLFVRPLRFCELTRDAPEPADHARDLGRFEPDPRVIRELSPSC